MGTTESRAAANVGVVGGIYEAFGRGDIEFILGQIADDCAWESWLDNHGQNAPVHWLDARAATGAGPAEMGCCRTQLQVRSRTRGATSAIADQATRE
jgi:hypothetical protein